MCSQKMGTLSMQSGAIFGQESPCGILYGRLCILLRSQSSQEEVERRRDHVLRFDDKQIEEWCGIHCGSSMRREDNVGIRGEIVPELFQMDCGV